MYRYKEGRGRFVFSSRSDFSFDIEIPCKLVARFLAADITACEVWNDKSSGSDDYPTCKKQIGDYLWLAGELNQKIVNLKFVQVDRKSRDESRIRLEFGAITTPKKLIHDYPRAYIETDTNGAFTLKLPQNLMTCLLAGKITAGEAWKSENNQKIGDFLKDAVSRGQEIIDARLVQVGSEAESEPSLILKFGAATDTTIREDKKRIQEEKQRRRQLKKLEVLQDLVC